MKLSEKRGSAFPERVACELRHRSSSRPLRSARARRGFQQQPDCNIRSAAPSFSIVSEAVPNVRSLHQPSARPQIPLRFPTSMRDWDAPCYSLTHWDQNYCVAASHVGFWGLMGHFSVTVPTFVCRRSGFVCECPNQRDIRLENSLKLQGEWQIHPTGSNKAKPGNAGHILSAFFPRRTPCPPGFRGAQFHRAKKESHPKAAFRSRRCDGEKA